MTEKQYKIHSMPKPMGEALLNDYGRDGWDLVTAYVDPNARVLDGAEVTVQPRYVYHFMRDVEE